MANFVFHVDLARLVSGRGYGAFALVYSGFVFLMGMHTTLLAEPTSVLGVARHSDHLGGYLHTSIRLHWRATALVVPPLIVGGIGLTLWRSDIGGLAIIMTIVAPVQLLWGLVRRIGYLRGATRPTTLASLAYAGTLVCGLLTAHQLHAETGRMIAATVTLGVAPAVALQFFPRTCFGHASPEAPALETVALENWHYGKWLWVGGLAFWGSQGAIAPVLAVTHGLGAVGAFRALENLIAPVRQIVTAVGAFLTPRLAGSPLSCFQTMTRLAILTIPPGSAYLLLILVFRTRFFSLLYGAGRFREAEAALGTFVAYALVGLVLQGAIVTLRIRQKTRGVFLLRLAGALVGAGAGVPLIVYHGVHGAVLTLGVVAIVNLLGALLAMARAERPRRNGQPRTHAQE